MESRYTAPGPLRGEHDVIIPKGAGVAQIARDLAGAGVIGNARIFRWGMRAFAARKQLRAGEFRFPAGVSVEGAISILQSGRTVVRRLTIAEGLTNAEVGAALASAQGLVGAVGDLPEEGGLLPETYHFSFGDERRAVLNRMTDEMRDLLDQLWRTRADGLPLETPREALVLASIVEKETGIAAERARVAAVFVNRLRRGMRLQSDPTVVYGITGGRQPLDRPLSRADLRTPTPYNTYVINGLPPTAIANPGRAALEAVMRPMASDELYFVADGSGGHAFARTLAEHNANVANWRRLQRRAKRLNEPANN